MVAVGRNVLIVVVALAGCRQILGIESGAVIDASTEAGSGDPDGATSSDSAYRKLIKIKNVGGEDLENFPISIVRDSDPDLAAHARPDARDIQFVLGNQLLAFDLVSFDASTGAFEAWVNIPKLQAETDIELRYGGGAFDHDASLAWTDAFAGAWHLPPSATQGYLDSTAHAHHGTAQGTARPTAIQGIAGLGANFDGVNDAIGIGDPADGSLDFTDAFAISLWVNVTASSGAYDMVLTKGGSSTGTSGYDFELGTGAWRANVSDGASFIGVDFGSESEFLGKWIQLAFVFDTDTRLMSTYIDGAARNIAPIPPTFGSLASSSSLMLSRSMYSFKGLLDEVRIYKDVRSAAWFAMEHRALATPSQVIVVGFEEAL